MIRAVIFDIGGVLAHDVWEHLLLDEKDGIASICNLNVEQVQRVGQNLWKQFAHRAVVKKGGAKELEEEYWKLFIEEFHLSMSVDDFVQLTDKFIQPVYGMSQLLERLYSKGIDLAICSNNTEFWFKRQMDTLDLHRFFRPTRVILSNRIGVSKSSPRFEMFQATINALGMEKNLCVFVDDRKENIQQALRFGLVGILFPSHSKYGAQYLEALLEKMGVF
jgi:HAD superfamily hydrolase (TIGR01509 family)